MFNEFGPGGEGITKQRFSAVMRDILLGLGDGLEREPIALRPLDGSELERWARSGEFEVEAVAAFGRLDADMSGKVKAEAIKKAMRRVSVNQGMPPQNDDEVQFSSYNHISLSFLQISQHARQKTPFSSLNTSRKWTYMTIVDYLSSQA